MKKKDAPVLIPLAQDESTYAEWSEDEVVSKKAHDEYQGYIFRKVVFIVVCVVLAVAMAIFGLTIGPYKISFVEVYQTLWDHITGDICDSTKDIVVWKLRLPRILAALIAGAGLAIAGATMQSTMKNPLADPYTTGISSGAALGASLAMGFGIGIGVGRTMIVVDAFIFSLIPTIIIIVISAVKKVSPVSMILAGIAVMYLFNAMTTVVKLWADPDSLAAIYRWQIGSFYYITWDDLPIMFGVVLFGIIVLMFLSKKINVLSMGDDSAKSLGINATHLRILCLGIVSVVAAAVVSFTGVIGFIGLVAPHIARIFVGSDNRYLFPASLAFGGALLLLADIVGRIVIYPDELQVGVVTAFLGAPLFLYMILRKKEAW